MARPREFQPDIALESLKRAFWEKGYHGTSMQDLEAATGLRKQSLYREFGNKDSMYARALQLYCDKDMAQLSEVIMRAPTAYERFRDLFYVVLAPVRLGDRYGCFVCNAAIDHAGEDSATMQAVKEGIEGTIALFDRALAISAPYKENQTLRAQTATSLATSYFGLRVMVRGGIPLESLLDTVRIVLKGIDNA